MLCMFKIVLFQERVVFLHSDAWFELSLELLYGVRLMHYCINGTLCYMGFVCDTGPLWSRLLIFFAYNALFLHFGVNFAFEIPPIMLHIFAAKLWTVYAVTNHCFTSDLFSFLFVCFCIVWFVVLKSCVSFALP